MKIALKTEIPENLYDSYRDYVERYYGAKVTKEDGFVRVSYEANTVQCMEVVSITNLYRLSETSPVWE